MDYVIEIPEHRPGDGLRFEWEPGFEIAVAVDAGEVAIRANRAGLISLARHLLTLAQDEVSAGAHVHLTADQEIESDIDLILERSAEE